MAKGKDTGDGYPVGNQDPNRRGRGPKDAIGQKIPKDAKDRMPKPKEDK